MDSEVFPPPRDARCPFNPPPNLLERQRQFDVSRYPSWDGLNPWLVVGYDNCRAALSDPALSSNPRNPGWSESSPAFLTTMSKDVNLRTVDDPEHGRLRRMLTPEFTGRKMTELTPWFKSVVDDQIDAIVAKGGPFDLVQDYAVPIPLMIIAEMLGIPREEISRLSEPSTKLMGDVTPEDAAVAGREILSYLGELVERKRAEPDDRLISKLLRQFVDPGEMSETDLLATVRLLVVAGHETTANHMGLTFLYLIEHTDVLAQLRDTRDDDFIANGVEELLRFMSPAHEGRRRVAVADTTIGNASIKTAEPVIVATSVADRDQTVFVDPDIVDLRRPNAKRHLAFGYGAHACLGQNLTRAELRYAIPELLRRLPGLRLAQPVDEIVFKESHRVYGIERLLVDWDSSGSEVLGATDDPR